MAHYPLGYMISSEDESDCHEDNIGKYSTDDIDEIIPITLHFDQIKHFEWLVNISDDEYEYGAMFALGNDELMKDSRIGVTSTRNNYAFRNRNKAGT